MRPCIPAEEDRRERRRKLGLPEELTAEEVEAQRAREAEATANKEAQRLKDILPIKPVSGARPPLLTVPCLGMGGRWSQLFVRATWGPVCSCHEIGT